MYTIELTELKKVSGGTLTFVAQHNVSTIGLSEECISSLVKDPLRAEMCSEDEGDLFYSYLDQAPAITIALLP